MSEVGCRRLHPFLSQALHHWASDLLIEPCLGESSNSFRARNVLCFSRAKVLRIFEFTESHAVDGRPGNRSRICSRMAGSGSSESFGNSERMRASLEVSSRDESATMLSINSCTHLPWNCAAIGRTAKVAAALASPSYEPSANKAALRL